MRVVEALVSALFGAAVGTLALLLAALLFAWASGSPRWADLAGWHGLAAAGAGGVAGAAAGCLFRRRRPP
jgi:hypothetical protein